MSTEYLLYQLMSDKTFAKIFFEQRNIKKDFNKKKLDELNIQKDNMAEICDFFGGLANLNLNLGDIRNCRECFDAKTKYFKEYDNKQYDIYMLESALTYLLISGKLSIRKAKKLGFDIDYLKNLLSHYRIYISPQGELIKSENSWLFLEFMLANGFKPENYNNILELIQAVPNSMSQYLTCYSQFLLSEKVKYSDLQTYDIKGANGYIDNGEGIIVPKSIEADEYFRNRQNKVPNNQIPRYIYPTITDFDSIIAYYDQTTNSNPKLLKEISSTLCFPIKNDYVGFIANKDDENLSKLVNIFSTILESINKLSSQEHMLVHDTISNQNKEFYLIKKR